MKKLTIITTLLIASYSINAKASTLGSTFYGGLSFQKNRLNFNKSYDSINNIGYDEVSSEVSGFIGYEFPQASFSPYQLSIETSYFTDKNSLHSSDIIEGTTIVKSGFNSDIRTSILSLNTINHYHFGKRVSLIGILGLNYANFKFNEHSTIPDHNISDKQDGFGVNYGIGLSFNPTNIYNIDLNRILVRTKIVRSVFKDINPNADSINKINGMMAISIDFRFNF